MMRIFVLVLVLGIFLAGCSTVEKTTLSLGEESPNEPAFEDTPPENTNIDEVFGEDDEIKPPQMPS